MPANMLVTQSGQQVIVVRLTSVLVAACWQPNRTPTHLQDVGCETQSVREDAFYAGLPQRRQRGEQYDVLVDETIGALRKRQAPQQPHIDDDTSHCFRSASCGSM